MEVPLGHYTSLAGTTDEIIQYLQGLESTGQALMTLGFVHFLRFLMVEVSEASHFANNLNNPGVDMEPENPVREYG